MSFLESVILSNTNSIIAKFVNDSGINVILKMQQNIDTHGIRALTLSGVAFSDVRQALGGGGVRDPDAKNQGYHQRIDMKFCTSYLAIKAYLMQNLRLVTVPVSET